MMLTFVVVLYNQRLEKSKTMSSLLKAIAEGQIRERLEVIVYDNSQEAQEVKQLHPGLTITYHHDPRNLGVAVAYNYAWKVAVENGSKWLVLLDHDTHLTGEYIRTVTNLSEYDTQIAALVPNVMYEGTHISPVYSDTLRPLQGDKPKIGIQSKAIMAINSGAVLNVDFLNEIQGFNEEFALDYLDHWLFYKIDKEGYQVELLDVTLEHDLSVMDYNNVSLTRYQSILSSEFNFYKNYKKELFPAYRIQLLKRIAKQIVMVKNKKIAYYTIRQLLSNK
ncbi:glycosyltransferase [Bacillus sp. BGMRC 2118]|nr:glycosyltransferase [Bacillus sp. BGMRC 2118]